MVQSAEIKPLFMINNDTGEMALKIHKVGINFTDNQNIVKIPNTTKMFT